MQEVATNIMQGFFIAGCGLVIYAVGHSLLPKGDLFAKVILGFLSVGGLLLAAYVLGGLI